MSLTRPPYPSGFREHGDAGHSKEVASCRLASFTSPHLESHFQVIENSKDSMRTKNALADCAISLFSPTGITASMNNGIIRPGRLKSVG